MYDYNITITNKTGKEKVWAAIENPEPAPVTESQNRKSEQEKEGW